MKPALFESASFVLKIFFIQKTIFFVEINYSDCLEVGVDYYTSDESHSSFL